MIVKRGKHNLVVFVIVVPKEYDYAQQDNLSIYGTAAKQGRFFRRVRSSRHRVSSDRTASRVPRLNRIAEDRRILCCVD